MRTASPDSEAAESSIHLSTLKSKEDTSDAEWDAFDDSSITPHAGQSTSLLNPSSPDPSDLEHQAPYSPQPRPPPKQLHHLDGLRGLAALIVYINHHESWFYGPASDIQNGFGYHSGSHYFVTLPYIRIFFTGGGPAVAVFFILSGYVLSRSTLQKFQAPTLDAAERARGIYRALLGATVRRPFRLFLPVAGISLVFALVLETPFRPLFGWQDRMGVGGVLVDWAGEMAFIVNPFVGHEPSKRWFKYDPPAWTMPYEFVGSVVVFSMLVGVTALVSGEARYRLAVFAGLGVMLLLVGQWHLAEFMVGAAFAQVDVAGLDQALLARLEQRHRTWMLHGILLVAGYLLSQVSGGEDAERSNGVPGWYVLTTYLTPRTYLGEGKEYFRFWNAIGAALLIYAIQRLPWAQQVLARLKYLGRISFAFYLAHIPLLWLVGARAYRAFGFRLDGNEHESMFDDWIVVPDWGPKGLTLRFLVSQAVILPITMSVAHMATVWIDEPSVKASRWISQRLLSEKG